MKVLVSASSRHGATAEIAHTIETVLAEAGLEVDCIVPELVGDLPGYDALVIGSGVYAGRWLAPARELVERAAGQPDGRPVWLFSSGPIGDPAKPGQPPAEGVELARRVQAVDHQVFEGRIDRNHLGFAERTILRVVGAPTGDFRPWEAIIEWARGIASELATRTAGTAGTPVAQAAG